MTIEDEAPRVTSDELPGRDDLAAGHAQQMVGLAQDLAGRGDAGHECAERPGGSRLARVQVDQLGEPQVEVVVLVSLAAGTSGDRDDLGHAVGVIDELDAERPGGRPRQARGQHLTANF